MQPVEIVPASSKKVVCEGGEGALGHPRVYLTMGDNPHVDCPYCGRRFVADMAIPAGKPGKKPGKNALAV